eukprot:58332-Pleurochrysis_carterae.AAC.1
MMPCVKRYTFAFNADLTTQCPFASSTGYAAKEGALQQAWIFIVDEYIEAGVSHTDVFIQSFYHHDIMFLVNNYPDTWGKQA